MTTCPQCGNPFAQNQTVKRGQQEYRQRFKTKRFCSNLCKIAWNNANRKPQAKDSFLRRTYGISLERYQEMAAEQGFVCAICGIPETLEGRDLGVDHCHVSGKVRGLLCVLCNNGLGTFGDSIERLESAVAYLKKHS